MKDELGDRMKKNYEDRTRYSLPRRTYTIIRLDGKAFHTYTRGLKKPFDDALSKDMDDAIIAMLPQIQGAVFAYTQSDEISILLTDFALDTTSAWFDGNLQKMCSVSASIITSEFNKRRIKREIDDYENNLKMTFPSVYDCPNTFVQDTIDTFKSANYDRPNTFARDIINTFKSANFDARVFTIPDPIEVMNYFIWRNNDCSRNSVSMVAQHEFSHKELQCKSTGNMIEMLRNKGTPWENYSDENRYGRFIIKYEYEAETTTLDSDGNEHSSSSTRTRWVSKPAWKFTADMDKLKMIIPKYE